MRIYIVKNETDVGPFFSSEKALREYLMDDDNRSTDFKGTREQHVERIIDGRDPYCSVVPVTLDDHDAVFDS